MHTFSHLILTKTPQSRYEHRPHLQIRKPRFRESLCYLPNGILFIEIMWVKGLCKLPSCQWVTWQCANASAKLHKEKVLTTSKNKFIDISELFADSQITQGNFKELENKALYSCMARWRLQSSFLVSSVLILNTIQRQLLLCAFDRWDWGSEKLSDLSE